MTYPLILSGKERGNRLLSYVKDIAVFSLGGVRAAANRAVNRKNIILPEL